jgi:uncharacterized protein YdeI (YjbR/CyaY-like superfamily)
VKVDGVKVVEVGETLYVHERDAWRAWLARHHASAREIWLVYYKKASGKPRISYNDAVDEAICFGWIDSIVKAIDGDCFAQRFTPRRKGSPCSELNKARAKRLIKEGQMTAAGLRALDGTLGKGARIHKGAIRESKRWSVPSDILEALQNDALAWKHFRKLPLTYRRIRIAFIEGARKRPEIFKRRLGYFIKMTARNKRFGMVRE